MTEIKEHQTVERDQVLALDSEVRSRLTTMIAEGGEGFKATDEVKKWISKRVPPKLVENHHRAEWLAELLVSEVDNIAERIRLYPFTARYREAITFPSRDMFSAFQIHSHSLRQGEIYIILEHGGQYLRFLKDVVKNLGKDATDSSKAFEKKFKVGLEYRLRERHRMVHTHERPSLASRIIELSVVADDTNKIEVASTLGGVLARMASVFPGKETDSPEDKIKHLLSLSERYVSMAEEEAATMFRLFREAVLETLRV